MRAADAIWTHVVGVAMDQESDVVSLQFRAQSDGRKVSRLGGGKVVLVDLAHVDRVSDGEWWLVRLRHRETFAVAEPIERLKAPPPDARPAAASPAPVTVNRQESVTPPIARPTVTTSSPASTARPPMFEIQGMLVEPDNIVRPEDRVAMFVDGANMDHACREAGFFVDYKKARDLFVGQGVYYAGFYYVADVTATDPIQTRFFDFLAHAGYIIRRKPVKVITDTETGERVYKGNLDTEIVLDMLNTVNNYDVAYLFSGDSDFERAVDLLRSRGKRVYVVTNRKTISRELAYISDKPVFFIEDFRGQIGRDDR